MECCGVRPDRLSKAFARNINHWALGLNAVLLLLFSLSRKGLDSAAGTRNVIAVVPSYNSSYLIITQQRNNINCHYSSGYTRHFRQLNCLEKSQTQKNSKP